MFSSPIPNGTFVKAAQEVGLSIFLTLEGSQTEIYPLQNWSLEMP